MTQINLPKTSQTGTNEWADVEDNDVAIRNVVNGNLDTGNLSASAGITSGQLASGAALANLASASVTDAKLASPNNSVYRSLQTQTNYVGNATTAATYFPATSGGTGANWLLAVGVGSTGPSTAISRIDLLAADYTVASLSTKLRLRTEITVGAALGTAPTSITAGLYPLTASAGTWAVGTVVTGSTAAISTFTANSTQRAVGTDFTFPSDGIYAIGFVYAGAGTYGVTYSLSAALQLHHV